MDKPPDPSLIEAKPRPDWYLLWYFAVLALMPHALENNFIILGPLLAGAILFLLPLVSNKGERSPRRRRWAVAAVLMTVVMIVTWWAVGTKSNWSPNFNAEPLPANVVVATSDPVFEGARLLHSKGCLNCHLIESYGGRRGPPLIDIGNKLSSAQMILRIANGGVNMPAYAANLAPAEMDALGVFLQWGEDPIRTGPMACYLKVMNILLLVVVLLLLFGGGGFFFGGPMIGGGGLGLVLLICLVIYFMGGFRSSKS